MFTTVTGATDSLLAVTLTTLSVIVLVISLIMGLKLRWFRTRIYNIQASKGSSEVTPTAGVYRGLSFETASAAPQVRPPANMTASSSSYRVQQSSSSSQVPPPSSSGHKLKTDSKKKYPASSSENPLVLQSQLSGSKQDQTDRNKSKHQSATPKNPLAKPDEHDERSKAEKPPRSKGQNMKPENKVPVPKRILQTELPPLPVTHDDNSKVLELNDDYYTSRKLTDDNRTSRRETDDNRVSHKPGHGGSKALKSKTPIPQYVTGQDESESET
jgi:hypothetical protein